MRAVERITAGLDMAEPPQGAHLHLVAGHMRATRRIVIDHGSVRFT